MTPQPITIDDRSGTVVYLNDKWIPVPPDQATRAKVVFDDGGSAFYHIEQVEPKLSAAWVGPPQGQEIASEIQALLTALGGPGSGRYPKGSGGESKSEIPKTTRHAEQLITSASGIKEIFVSDHPNALRASVVVASSLKEMKDRGYRMPDTVIVEITVGGTPSGETVVGVNPDAPMGQRSPRSTLSIRLPHKAPHDVPLDDLVSTAFSGKTETLAMDRQPGYQASSEVDKFTVRTMKDVIVHEMGHVQHMMASGDTDDFGDISNKLNAEHRDDETFKASKWIDMAAKQVSKYAAKNSKEFVAESFTRLYRGETLKPEAAKLYAMLKGPAIR